MESFSMRTSALKCWTVISMLLLLMVCSSGCANRIIKARRMPDRYQAAKVTNAQVADLSRLSMSTTSSSLIEPEDVVDVTISSGLEEAGRITPTPVRVDNNGIATIASSVRYHLQGLNHFRLNSGLQQLQLIAGCSKHLKLQSQCARKR